MKTFLFELGCEELPSAYVRDLSVALGSFLYDKLTQNKIPSGDMRTYGTPRRLACKILVDENQLSSTFVRKGPSVSASFDSDGNPTKSLICFAQSCDCPVEELKEIHNEKGSWMMHKAEHKGEKTISLLPMIIQQVINELPIKTPMRWGEGEIEFARPVHWAVMMLDDCVLHCEVLGLTAGNCTYGHRFHHPESIELLHAEDYERSLLKAKVIADFDTRRVNIKNQILEIESEFDISVINDSQLLDEVTGLVEWPNALLCEFDRRFLELPDEVLITTLHKNQKVFPTVDKDNILCNKFIVIANITSKEPSRVIIGNERVVRARLNDAYFFYNLDIKRRLEEFIEETKAMTNKVLGTNFDRTQRMKELIKFLVSPMNLNIENALRAATLSKCDLNSSLVVEFPELQGVIGMHYARRDGEAEEVAVAIGEHYFPRFSNDCLPESSLGLALSIVDRIDIICGAYCVVEKSRGWMYSYSIRRNAIAIARMVNEIHLKGLKELIKASVESHGGNIEIADTVYDFITSRIYDDEDDDDE
jgi:glycyl-tRNA synthetase beta chain